MKKCSVCKKLLSLNNFFKNKWYVKDGLSTHCKKCSKKLVLKYANTEKGSLTVLYISMVKKIKNTRYANFSEEEKNKHRCYLTKEQFLKKWEEHVLKHGYKCALSGEEIIFKRTSHKDSVKSNTVSVDRLNPKIGYTEDNIIFVSSKINNMKGAVTKELCAAIIKAHEERGV